MSKEEIIKLFFDSREETIKIINTGGDLFKYLTGTKTFCPLIGSKIKLERALGKGSYGQVFEISFPGGAKGKKYAVKRSTVFNLEPCTKQRIYPRLDGQGVTIAPIGSSICDMAYSEYAISLLAGEFVRSGKCINFLDVFAFSTCPDIIPIKHPMYMQGSTSKMYNEKTIHRKGYRQYTFMEQISTSVRKSIGCIMERTRGRKQGLISLKDKRTITNSIFIQTLFAIACLQTLNIVHGDLHDDNIFLLFDENYEYQGQRISDFDYYEYVVNGDGGKTRIYLPAIPIIVKVGDFGLAVKYSTDGGPMIGDKTTMRTGYDQGDLSGPWLPNFYSSAYDPTFVTFIFFTQNPSNEFIQQIAGWVSGVPESAARSKVEKSIGDMISLSPPKNVAKGVPPGTGRPKIKELDDKLAHVSAKAILTNQSLMEEYTKKPPKGSKILTIGSI